MLTNAYERSTFHDTGRGYRRRLPEMMGDLLIQGCSSKPRGLVEERRNTLCRGHAVQACQWERSPARLPLLPRMSISSSDALLFSASSQATLAPLIAKHLDSRSSVATVADSPSSAALFVRNPSLRDSGQQLPLFVSHETLERPPSAAHTAYWCKTTAAQGHCFCQTLKAPEATPLPLFCCFLTPWTEREFPLCASTLGSTENVHQRRSLPTLP